MESTPKIPQLPAGSVEKSKEQLALEYFQNIEGSVESPDLQPILAVSRNIKESFKTIIQESSDPKEAVGKIANLGITAAESIDPQDLQSFIEKPYLFQALFLARESHENDINLQPRKDWEQGFNKEYRNFHSVDKKSNASFVLLDAITLAYISKDLDPELRKQFIADSISSDRGGGTGNIRLANKERLLSKLLSISKDDEEKLRSNAQTFRDSVWTGKTFADEANKLTSVRGEIREAYRDLYETFGNDGQMFLNEIINQELFNYSSMRGSYLKEIIVKAVRNQPEKIEQARKILIDYYMRPGTASLEQAEQWADEDLKKAFNP